MDLFSRHLQQLIKRLPEYLFANSPASRLAAIEFHFGLGCRYSYDTFGIKMILTGIKFNTAPLRKTR